MFVSQDDKASRFLFSVVEYTRNVLCQFDLTEGDVLRALFTRSQSPFCLYFFGPAVICCDKAALTSDARVSRVEGHARRSHTGPFEERGPCSTAEEGYDIFVIMLPDTCPSVTTAPGNKLPLDLFFTLWPCARTYNTSRHGIRENQGTLRSCYIYG